MLSYKKTSYLAVIGNPWFYQYQRLYNKKKLFIVPKTFCTERNEPRMVLI
jgi:hypothetical protein